MYPLLGEIVCEDDKQYIYIYIYIYMYIKFCTSFNNMTDTTTICEPKLGSESTLLWTLPLAISDGS